MRERQFRFTRGDIVHVAKGLEWASPLKDKDARSENVEILEARADYAYGRMNRRYLVRSLDKPDRQYVLSESFIRRTEGYENRNKQAKHFEGSRQQESNRSDSVPEEIAGVQNED